MAWELEGIYADGVIKFDAPLPLVDQQRVKVTIEPATDYARRSYGIIGWTGDAETVRRLADDPEFGVAESP